MMREYIITGEIFNTKGVWEAYTQDELNELISALITCRVMDISVFKRNADGRTFTKIIAEM